MKFKVDENMPREAVDILHDAGHDATTVHDQGLSGAQDPVVALCCQQEARVLLTLDTDFGNIQAYPPSESSGIVVLRLQHQDKARVLQSVRDVVAFLERESPVRSLWIVDEDRVRIRK